MSAIDLTKKKKIGFVCSGGAVKAAAFHMGVAMALEQRGFRFTGSLVDEFETPFDPGEVKSVQTYVGSSAGSLVTTYLAQGGQMKDLVANFRQADSDSAIPGLRYWEMLAPRARSALDLISFDNFWMQMIKNRSFQSPFSTQGLANYLRSHVIRNDRFSGLQADLFIVATELNRSKKVVFGKYKSAPVEPYLEYRNDVSISDACAASMSLPPVYHPYTIQVDGESRRYFDGEIREPLSSHVALETGCDLIICSYTHQPLTVSDPQKSLSEEGVVEITIQAIYQAIEQKIWVARGIRQKERALVDLVRKFFKDKQLPMDALDELVEKLEARMTYKSNVDYIYIHPRPSDAEMFYAPHFSLNKAKTEQIVRRGFLACLTAMRGLTAEKTTVKSELNE